MKKMKLVLMGLFLLVLSFALMACGKKDAPLSVVRIAHFPNVTHAQALVGRDLGLFEKHLGDLETKYFVFNAGPSEIEAFFAGELDLGYIGPVPAINGNLRSNGEIVILAGATNAGAMLLVSKDSDIDSVAQLANKKIAIPQIGNTQHLSLLNLLSENDLSDTTKGGNVEVVPVSNPDIKVLLENGGIDAAYVPEPWASRLLYEIEAKILLDEREVFMGGDYSTALVIGRREFVEAHPEVVKGFLRAHLEATTYLKDESEMAKAILNNQIEALTGQKLALEVMDSVFERLTFSYDPVSESVLEFMRISKEEQLIDHVTEKSKLFDYTLLNELLSEIMLPPVK